MLIIRSLLQFNCLFQQGFLVKFLHGTVLSTGKIIIMTNAILLALNVSCGVSGARLSNDVAGMNLVVAQFRRRKDLFKS